MLPQRQPDDVRIAVVGGDLAFGWGVAAAETVAAYLQTLVSMQAQRPGEEGRLVSVANLGARGLPARDYAARITRFGDLQPDVICLYVDLADASPQSVLPPADSAVYRLTGYVPILPLVLAEKGRQWQDDGMWVRGKTLEAAGRTLRGADRWLSRFTAAPVPASGTRAEAVVEALDVALDAARGVVVVLPTPRSAEERREHARLRDLAESRLAVTPRLRIVDLADHPRLGDPDLRLDGVNFGAGGHSLTATEIAPAVIDLLAAGGQQ